MICADFYISIRLDRRYIRLKVQQIYLGEALEKYRISGNNRSIVLQSNRPLLRAKGMKYKRPNWKVTEGHIQNASFLETLINTVNDYLKAKEKN